MSVLSNAVLRRKPEPRAPHAVPGTLGSGFRRSTGRLNKEIAA